MRYAIHNGELKGEFKTVLEGQKFIFDQSQNGLMSALNIEGWELLDDDEMYERTQNFISEYGMGTDDIMLDEDGREYILVESDNGNPSEEGYRVETQKVFIQYKKI